MLHSSRNTLWIESVKPQLPQGTHLRRNNVLAEKLKSGELEAEKLASMGDEAEQEIQFRCTEDV